MTLASILSEMDRQGRIDKGLVCKQLKNVYILMVNARYCIYGRLLTRIDVTLETTGHPLNSVGVCKTFHYKHPAGSSFYFN